RKAKGVNFLKAYGGGKKKLGERLKISTEEAREWLLKWDVTYPGVPFTRWKNRQSGCWKCEARPNVHRRSLGFLSCHKDCINFLMDYQLLTDSANSKDERGAADTLIKPPP